MDPQAIYQLLEATMHPDTNVRSQVEQQLKSQEILPGFLFSLLTILKTDSSPNVRQAAAIYFKNRIQQSYDPTRKNAISEQERQAVRENLLIVLVQVNHVINIRTQLIAALGLILTCDANSDKWPAFLPTVHSMLNTEDLSVLHTGLLSLQELTKVFQWSSHAKRAPLDSVISSTFPMLHNISSKLMSNSSLQAGEMVKIIAKIFCCSARLELSKTLQDVNVLSGWATVFIQIIEFQIQDNLPGYNVNDLEEREKFSWWKAKKWAFQCLYLLYSRYSRALKRDKRYVAFSKTFMEFFVPNIISAYLKQLQHLISGVWMSSRVKQQLAMFLEECIKPKSTWLLIKPHLEVIIIHFIFPLLCFTDADQELWDSDPVEFIHKKIDPPVDDYRSPITAAEELLSAIVKDRFKQTFIPTMTFINSILTSYQNSPPEQRNPRHKDGVLRMISYLADDVLADESPVKDQMENFIVTHIVPELSCPNGFLRARACDVLLKFGDVDYKNEGQLTHIFQGLMHCLKDPELSVRVSAALAISPFLRHKVIHESMKPHAHTIMQELLNLTNEIDMDTLTHVMENLVEDFSEELAPFAVQLATQLKDTFLRIMGDANLDGDDLDMEEAENKTMAAMGVLKTLSSVIMAVEASKPILAELEITVAPALIFVLQNNYLDLYEEVFEIIEMTTYCSKTISPLMWQMFDLVYNSFKTDAFDYLEDMAPSIDNYLSFGADFVMQNPALQERFFDIINTILVGEDTGTGDRVRAFQLMESMMLNLKPCIDSYIPRFMQVALQFLSDEAKIKNIPFRVHAIEVIINALYYNPILALTILEQNSATLAFFGIWFKNIEYFSRVHDKKLCILAICHILELPLSSLPSSVQTGWLQLFDGLLSILDTYGAALELRKHEERLQNGEIDEDDEDEAEDEEETSAVNISHTSTDLDDECQDENDDYLEYLENKGREHDEDEEDDDEEWDLDATLDEDVYFTTVLDKLDAYNRFEDLMNALSSRPDVHGHLTQSLNEDKKKIMEQMIVKSRQIRSSAVSLNNNQLSLLKSNNESLFWSLRPNLYFGARARAPNSLLTGLLWFNSQDFESGKWQKIRHECNQDDNLSKYGWQKHDGRIYGSQNIIDSLNGISVTTRWIKIPGGEHGGSWALRVSGTPLDKRNSSFVSFLFYAGLDTSKSGYLKRNKNLEPTEYTIQGNSNDLGNFKIIWTEAESNNSPLNININSIKVPNDEIWKAKDYITESMLSNGKEIMVRLKKRTPYETLIAGSKKNENNNLHLFQKSFAGDFQFDIVFASESAAHDFSISSGLIDNMFENADKNFQDRFEKTFQLHEKGFDDEHVQFSQLMLGNMLGGIGYFYGTNIVDRALEGHDEFEPIDYIEETETSENSDYFGDGDASSSAKSLKPNPQFEGPFSLYSAVPSRSFFPRGFLWDEGFHQLLIGEWDNSLSLEIIDSWCNLIDEKGWVSREQILGDEARSKVPKEFQVQYPNFANPPTLILAVAAFMDRLKVRGTLKKTFGSQSIVNSGNIDLLINMHYNDLELSKAYLTKIYGKMKMQYNWFREYQWGDIDNYGRKDWNIDEGYRWRGRKGYHTLTSGLDDYPRSNEPHPGELHVDLISWVTSYAKTLKMIAQFLEIQSDIEKYDIHIADLLRALDVIHWNEDSKSYCDVSVNSNGDTYHVVHKGYISLFPMFLGLLDVNSEKLGYSLNLIRNQTEIWTANGLISLSKNDEFFGTGENYWRGPIWININFLVLRSLYKNYMNVPGPYSELANVIYKELRTNIINMVFNQYKETGYVWEQYTPEGRGQKSHPFTGWSALVSLIMAEKYS